MFLKIIIKLLIKLSACCKILCSQKIKYLPEKLFIYRKIISPIEKIIYLKEK